VVSRSKGDVLPVTTWGPVHLDVVRPGFRHVLLGLLLGVLVFPLLFGLGLVMVQAGEAGIPSSADLTKFLSSDGLGMFSSMVSLWLGLLLAVFVAGRRYPGGLRAMLGWKFSWVDSLIAVVLVVVLEALTVAASSLISSSTGTKAAELGNTGAFTSVEPGWLIAIGLGVCLGAPVVEELFFRGLVFNVLAARTQTWVAVIVSALAFGSMHIQASFASSVYTVAATTLVGIVLAVARAWTGRLGTSICIHVLFNTAGFAAAMFFAG
jgi:membrane protease YdiL (CAAX protease family)